MKEIKLNHNKVALVDDEDYETLKQYIWWADLHGDTTWYAGANIDGRNQRMHRVIMGYPATQVDHRDGNGLNNQRSNLRLATHSQNQHNAGLRKDNSSGYKGVYRVTGSSNLWGAQVKRIYLGTFPSAKQAARAYDAKAVELYGEFARLNFPAPPEPYHKETQSHEGGGNNLVAKDMRKELRTITKKLANRAELSRRRMKYAQRVKRVLLKYGDDTDEQALFLARLCDEFDLKYNPETLCLDWMLEYYVAMRLERCYPQMQEIWRYLIDNNHHERNKLEYSSDCEAFFIDRERLIFVCGWAAGASRYLIIDEHGTVPAHSCYVREVWRRTTFNCIGDVEHPTLQHYRAVDFKMNFHDGKFCIYGDARDLGHVLTYKKLFDTGKADYVIRDITKPLRFFREIHTLWSQVEEK